MRSFAECVARKDSLLLRFVVALSLLLAISGAAPASAVDTKVNVAIAGSSAPDLQLDGSTSIVSSMPLIITGYVSNLTQLQVYVDGIYTATVPLTPADTSFSYSLWVNEGMHIVRFVGISAYTSTNVEQSVTLNYLVEEKPVTLDEGIIKSGSIPSTNGIIIGGNQGLEVPPTETGGGVLMPQWVVRLLVPLDIINPAKVDETPHMVGRFFLFALGLPLLVFTRPLMTFLTPALLKRRRYKKKAARLFLRRSTLLWLRLLGALLLVSALIWV